MDFQSSRSADPITVRSIRPGLSEGAILQNPAGKQSHDSESLPPRQLDIPEHDTRKENERNIRDDIQRIDRLEQHGLEQLD